MKQSILNLLLVIGIAIGLNVIGNHFYGYLDLTEEKRYTLTQPTQDLLENLDDVVYVNVLLEGEFPAGFKRLQKATREILDDFRSISGYVDYEFEDPIPNSLPVEEKNNRIKQLQNDGLRAKNLRIRDGKEQKTVRFYPYAVLTYKGRSIPVDLVGEDIPGMSSHEALNNSIGLLEYKLSNAIQKLQTSRKPVIAFTSSHGELPVANTQDIRNELRAFYEVGDVILDSLVQINAGISVLIVAKPTTAFSEKDKFKIDQYVMNGGKVIWLIDAMNVNLDSLGRSGAYAPYPYTSDLFNLDNLLFNYGVKINNSLAMDLQSTQIPQIIDERGTPQLFPWPYHLMSIPNQEHPITKSLGPVNLLFANTIDSFRTKTPIDKTFLLTTSERSKAQLFPMRLSFEILKSKPDLATYNKSFQPLGILLEGEFPSLYENRPKGDFLKVYNQLGFEYKTRSTPTKMLVVADGDIISNYADPAQNRYAPLGFNRYVKHTFANKDFLINAIEYMVDDNGVIAARSKEVKLRLLNETKAEEEETKWQIINIVVPLLLLLLFGFGYNYWRRWKYAR
ncbi:MAG: gliding motility-associated ABC transporter substrate-binding protein GldG [Saprospiraceae bacterium]